MMQDLYTVKDEVTGWNAPVFIQANDQEAIRTFAENCRDERSLICKYPKDFSLWHVGRRDTVDGRLEAIEPRLIIRAESVYRKEVQKHDEPRQSQTSDGRDDRDRT